YSQRLQELAPERKKIIAELEQRGLTIQPIGPADDELYSRYPDLQSKSGAGWVVRDKEGKVVSVATAPDIFMNPEGELELMQRAAQEALATIERPNA
ncbi:MAG: hypothetical protein EBZ48_14445, partial [Proteobacteria bacterium]|nr:hypothetical protein [Pseudomonadota bacterium]